MTIYKAKIKSEFYVEADSMPEAKRKVDAAMQKIPSWECNIKATKRTPVDFICNELNRSMES